MPELMKDKFYNYSSVHSIALRINTAYPSFEVDSFVSDVMDDTWDNLELKARMRHITLQLAKHLPKDYKQAIEIIDKAVAGLPQGYYDFALMSFPDFVEVYGQEECSWDLSMGAIERYTPSSTAEFAVRPFIIKNEKRMLEQLALWAKHDNEHVRRLASEGCRPALPWGQALVSFKKNPIPVLAVLEQLKADSSLYVRKSVANNLNDISKTHPELVIKTAKAWYGKNEYTNWIVKHGCRTLLKNGNKEVLAIFGFVDADCVKVNGFTLNTKTICVGENIIFSFEIIAARAVKLRLEYAIDYVKANHKRSRKIFQISEAFFKANQSANYAKAHSFAELSTRRYYGGIHSITLIVNGVQQATADFELQVDK